MSRALGAVGYFLLGAVGVFSAMILLSAGLSLLGSLLIDQLNAVLTAGGRETVAFDSSQVRAITAFSLLLPLVLLGHIQVSETAAQYRDFGALSEAVAGVPDSSLLIAAAHTAGLLALAILIAVSAGRLDRAATNASVVARLHAADETYIARILGITDFDQTRMGRGPGNVGYTDDVLAREATGGRGDARFTDRDGEGLADAALAETSTRAWFQRLLPIYLQHRRPTASGALRLAAASALTIVFIGVAFLATVDSPWWYIPLAIAIAAAVTILGPRQRWAHYLIQPAANARYSWIALAAALLAFVLCNAITGPLGFGFYLGLFSVLALLFLSQAIVYQLRKNGEADEKLAGFFHTLLNEQIHGTHSFAQCASCGSMTILLLGQAHPCEACAAPVDRAMNVRTVDV